MNQLIYLGIVEDRRNDPLKLGRVRVRVFGIHSESLEDIPTESLPWAIPIMPATSASLSGIGQTVGYVEGSLVFVFFQDGESKQQPIILGSAAGVPQEKTPFGSAGVYVTESFTDVTPVEPEIDIVFDGDSSNSEVAPIVDETIPETEIEINDIQTDIVDPAISDIITSVIPEQISVNSTLSDFNTSLIAAGAVPLTVEQVKAAGIPPAGAYTPAQMVLLEKVWAEISRENRGIVDPAVSTAGSTYNSYVDSTGQVAVDISSTTSYNSSGSAVVTTYTEYFQSEAHRDSWLATKTVATSNTSNSSAINPVITTSSTQNSRSSVRQSTIAQTSNNTAPLPISQISRTGTTTPTATNQSSANQQSSNSTVIAGIDCAAAIRKYGNIVSSVYAELVRSGITNNNAIIAILSNIGKESKFIPQRENMTYTTLKQLRAVFKTAFRTMSDDEASTYLSNPQKLANLVYANSDGNGSVESGDGFKYRGGGFIQLTKKSNYAAVGTAISVDLVNNPDQVMNPGIAAKVVAQYFINRFGGANRLSFPSIDDALVTVTKKVNPGGFARDYPIVVAESKLYINGAKLSDEQEKEISKPTDPENEVKKDATQEEINNGLISKKSIVTNKLGFKDPYEKYPLGSLLNEPDSNRLTRRNINDTIISKRRKNRRTNIKSTGVDSFVEPTSPYNAQYPYNKVHSTESGHVMEFDDTFGAERINIFHTTGTFVEIDANGNQTNKIVGDNFSITENNGYIYIDGMARVSVGGSVKIKVGGNLDIDVDGDLNYTVKGNINTKVGGNTTTNITGKSLYNIKGTAVYNHIGDCSYTAQAAFAITSKTAGLYTTGSMTFVAASINTGATGVIDMNAGKINLNSGGVPAAVKTPAVPVVEIAINNSFSPISYNNPENFVDSEIIKLDDADESDVAAHIEKSINSGLISQGQIDNGTEIASNQTVEKDPTVPPVSSTQIPESCSIFDTPEGLNDNIQISKSFTLAMVSTKTAVSKNKIVAQRGLTKSQIACNMKKVAENCLDQIKSQYSNMFVTSGFRPGSGTSHHELGEAIDMQFKGVPKSEYYDIAVWIKNNINFDKLLLEYKTTGSGMPWIHISYKTNPRKEVYTYMNNSKVSNDIRKLQ